MLDPVPIPGSSRLRSMVPGDMAVFPFREGKPRPDVQITSITWKIGGKFKTAVRHLIDTDAGSIEKVCIVLCIEAPPPPKKRGRPRKEKQPLPELREEWDG